MTPAGAALGRRIATGLDAVLHMNRRAAGADAEEGAVVFDTLGETLAREYRNYSGHVLICAAGIAVRLLAPLLTDKTNDPAVVVCDQAGRHAVSLVSGHLGGANTLARKVAVITGGEAVITTATDTAGLPAVDELAAESGLTIATMADARTVSASLLAGARLQLFDPDNRLGLDSEHESLFERIDDPEHLSAPSVAVDWRLRATYAAEGVLHLIPRAVCVGIGCRRGIAADIVDEALDRFLRGNAIAPAALCGLASIDAKAGEAGILETARKRGLLFTIYTARELGEVEVPNPSARVASHMGVESVCEAAAILFAEKGELVVPKTVWNGVTLAAAVRK